MIRSIEWISSHFAEIEGGGLRFRLSILKSSMVPPLVQTVFFEGQAPHCFDLCFSYHNIACTTVYDTSIDAEYSKVH